jgi:NAD(P)-dependent dehydrogenase (short-subunit alcohol dehydrogenase family)
MTKSKIALVTGGSRGLGKNMALALAGKGLDVIVTYNSKAAEAQDTVKGIEAMGQKAAALQLNVGDSKTFDGFFNQVTDVLKTTFNADKFDFIINNAGIGYYIPFAEMPEDRFDELMDIHLKGPYFLTQKALPHMADGGGIVNISSGLARITQVGSSAYATMKGGIETLTRYMAKELGSRGIRANVVAPGAIETDFGGGRVRDNKDINQFIASQTALGRVGLPDDIGGLVAFLCTEEAKWVNAQRIEASGGMFL